MLKDAAKKGDKDSCRVLAKEIVNARKAVNRLHASKAHLNSVQLSMKQQLGEDEKLSIQAEHADKLPISYCAHIHIYIQWVPCSVSVYHTVRCLLTNTKESF